MAIAFDAAASSVSAGFAAGASYTFNHTVAAGSNRAIVLGAALWQDVAGSGTLSTCSYAAAAATSKIVLTNTQMRAELWVLVAPATGTNTVSFTVTGNTDGRKFFAGSFTGVDQTTPTEATQTSSTSSGAPSLSITSITDNAWLVDMVSKFGTTALTVGAGQTSMFNNSVGSITAAASYEGPKTPAGAVTMNWTGSSANDCAQVAIALKAAAAAANQGAGFLMAFM
jgi:hypothetical protein